MAEKGKKRSWWNTPMGGSKPEQPDLPEPSDESEEPAPVKKKGFLSWLTTPIGGEKSPTPAPQYRKPTKQVIKDAEDEIKKTDDFIADADKSLQAPPRASAPIKPLTKLKCTACGALIPIYTEERPLRVTCPLCGRQSTLGTAAPKLKKLVKTPKAEGNVITYLRSVGLDAAAEGPDQQKREVRTIYDDEKALTIFSDGSSKYLIIDAEKKQVCTAIRGDDGKYQLIAVYSTEGISKLIGYTTAKPADKGDLIRMLYNTGDFLGTAREGNILEKYQPNVNLSPEYPALQSRLEEIIKKIPAPAAPPKAPSKTPPPAKDLSGKPDKKDVWSSTGNK